VVEAAAVRLAAGALAALAALLAAPAAARAQHGATPVVGGGSYNTAPLLAPGRYSDTVAAGETVYYKVHLEKGQVLSATATVDTSQIETDFQAADYDSGLAHLDYSLDIHSPLREPLSDEYEYRSASADLEGSPDAGAVRGTATGPRVLGYEQILGSDYDLNKFPSPGDWYVSVSAADSGIDPAHVPAELPLVLNLRVAGAPQPSSPDFASKLPGPAPSATAGPLATPAAVGGDAGAGDPALTIGLVGILALGGGLALGVLAAIVLGLGRATARR
jgi:Ca-activated chloride channel family protein